MSLNITPLFCRVACVNDFETSSLPLPVAQKGTVIPVEQQDKIKPKKDCRQYFPPFLHVVNFQCFRSIISPKLLLAICFRLLGFDDMDIIVHDLSSNLSFDLNERFVFIFHTNIHFPFFRNRCWFFFLGNYVQVSIWRPLRFDVGPSLYVLQAHTVDHTGGDIFNMYCVWTISQV